MRASGPPRAGGGSRPISLWTWLRLAGHALVARGEKGRSARAAGPHGDGRGGPERSVPGPSATPLGEAGSGPGTGLIQPHVLHLGPRATEVTRLWALA